MLSGLALFVIANLGTAIAPSFVVAMGARALAGLGASMFGPTATGSAASLVSPEKRGFALSVVVAGLSAATALGAPIGTAIGGLGDWRWTMVFVSALAAGSGVGVLTLLSHIPLPPAVSLTQRIAPAADPRVALTLACTLLYCTGQFTIYTYFSVVFDRVLDGNASLMAALLVFWGCVGTASNLVAGKWVDGLGSHKLIFTMLILLAGALLSLPWASASLWSTIVALAIWSGAVECARDDGQFHAAVLTVCRAW